MTVKESFMNFSNTLQQEIVEANKALASMYQNLSGCTSNKNAQYVIKANIKTCQTRLSSAQYSLKILNKMK